MPTPTIIPVASGKGGVGKSFLTANLAVALAEMGRRVVAVDLDLGGANLHSFLGLKNRYPGTGDFLKARSADLDDLIVPTGVENLGFVAGDARTPFMANIAHQQKQRLISRLRRLRTDYVLLDLSAGTSFNTLDFFRTSAFGLLVTLPEYPAIMNLMLFLKLLLVRSIEKAFSGQPAVRKLLSNEYARPYRQQAATIADLKSKIAALDPAAGETAATRLARIRPRVVFNRGRTPEDFAVSQQMDETIAEMLSIAVDYFGFVYEDPAVIASINAGKIHLLHSPQSPASEAVRRIAGRIEKYWETPIPDSAQRIRRQLDQGVPPAP